jgi:hypothetical protein
MFAVPGTGAFCLGFFVGYLAWYFVVRLRSYGPGPLMGIIAAVAGTVVMAFIQADEVGRGARWWYPIGLMAGWVLFSVAHRRGP